jgi:dihydroorotate dehydrogenase
MKLYNFYKNFAFRLDPETAHEYTQQLLHSFPFLANLNRSFQSERFHTGTQHMQWSAPVGIAAGLDKNAQMLKYFDELGIGALEVGTVTPRPQIGNDRPRIWRLADQESLRNAMGFPNAGKDIIKHRLQAFNAKQIKIGVNIGKNKDTPNEKAHQDYEILYSEFCDLADYIVINVSSPNTPGLRELQNIEALKKILESVLQHHKTNSPPLYLKLSPDMNLEDLDDIYKLSLEVGINGIISTNTTNQHDYGVGGLSGKYINQISKKSYSHFLDLNRGNEQFDIICVGGISSYQDLRNIWKMGGKLTQVYTSFIYQGPELFQSLAREIDLDLKHNNLSSVEELIQMLRKSD